MTTTDREHIGLWLDETSEPSDPQWIVSRDIGTTTHTIRAFDADQEAEAERFAAQVATREGLEVKRS